MRSWIARVFDLAGLVRVVRGLPWVGRPVRGNRRGLYVVPRRSLRG